MNGTVRQTVELSATEREALVVGETDAFGVAHLGLEWRPKETHFILEVAGQPVARAGVLRHDIRTERFSLRLAGLGGVITAKDARGQGHATMLIQHVMCHVGEAWGVDAALLFCLPSLVGFYHRQGFELVTTPVLIEQPAGRLPAPLPVMVRSLNEGTWPKESVTLGSLPW